MAYANALLVVAENLTSVPAGTQMPVILLERRTQ
jgi:hypothetical protein